MNEAPQIPMTDESSRKKGPKHECKTWGYPGESGEPEFASACSCGFNRVGMTIENATYVSENHWKSNFVDPTPPREEILITSKGHEVKVNMTDLEACDAMAKEAGQRSDRGRPNDFMESLVGTFRDRGKWSDGQRSWAHLMANQAVEPKPEPKLSSKSFPHLVEMLHTAAENLKFPRIVAEFDDGSVRLSIAGPRAKMPGAITVTSDGAYEDRTYYGRIHQGSGKFETGFKGAPNWLIDALTKFNEDPAGMAAAQGQRYGSCCFCNKELTTNESLEVGYGPICAGHYGLPWG